MIRTLTLLSAAISVVLSTIRPGVFENATMMQNDTLVYYMNKVFNVSEVNGMPTFKTNIGKLRNYMTPVAERPLNATYAKVEVIEYIDNTTYAVVLDNTHTIIQTVDIEGNRFSTSVDFTYFQFGTNIRCDDVEVYYPTEKAYVLCWDMEADPHEDPDPIYLIEFDLTNTANQRIIKVNQTDGYSAKHRLRMGIWNLPQGGQNEVYIVVYDQGLSSTDVTDNLWFRVFDGVRLGAAKYVGVVNVTAGFSDIRSLYDIFYFKNQLLMTSSILGQNSLAVTACSFYVGNMSINCDKASRKYSNVTIGYIGLNNNFRWVQFDTNTNAFASCEIGSSFYKPDWISSNCDYFKDIPKFEDCFIRAVEDNWHASVVIWVHPNGEYAGISVHSRELNRSWKEENVTAVLINKNLYVAETNKLLIRRLEYDSLLVTSRDLIQEENTITVSASDAVTAGVTSSAIFYLMEEATDNIHFDEDHTLPEVDVYGGYSFYMPLAESDFEGNNLTFTANFDESIANYTTATVYSTFPIDLIYTFKDTGLPEFKEITFTKNYAIGQDLQNRIFFFKCGTTEINFMRCDEKHSIATSDDVKLLKYSHEVQSFVLVATSDETRTVVHMYDPNSNTIYSKAFSGIAGDVHSVVVKGRTWIFASYADSAEVKVVSWSPVNPSYFHPEPSITQASSYTPYFCPTDVYDTYNGTSATGYLEVLSVCYNTVKRDQRIFRYSLDSLALVGSHPITLDINHPQICAVGDVYIIASINEGTVVGKSQVYDESTFYFYLDTFVDYTKLLGMNCVHRSGMVTIYFEDKYHKLGYFNLWADSLRKANKRVHSTVTGAQAGSVNLQSFAYGDSLLHVLYDNEGSMNYYKSFVKAPLIKIDVAHVSETAQNASGTMMLNMNNGGDFGASIQNNLTIRRLDRTINVSKSGNTTEMGKNFSLEDYVSIKGHVFNATLRGPGSTDKLQLSTSNLKKDADIMLIQRSHLVKTYIPSEVEQVVYQHIEAHGDYTIALHMDKSFASFFSIFTNVTEHRGVIQPRDGVQSFDFEVVSGGRALLVYSSAPVSGHKLKVMLISEASKVYEGSVEGKSYEKIRVARLDDKDNYLIMALDVDTQIVDFYTCSVTALSFSLSYLRTVTGVVDFDYTLPGKYLSFFYIVDEATSLQYMTWERKNVQGKTVADGRVVIQDERNYWLRSVSCGTDNDSQSSCAINTLGTIIYEVILKNGQDIPEKVHQIQKYGNYDGKNIYMDTKFIAMRAVSSTLPRKYAFLIWKRVESGGDGKTYCGVEIIGDSSVGTDIYSHFTPFTMATASNGDHMLFAGTHNEKEPLQFYKIDKFVVDNSAKKADLSKIYLDIQGFGGSVAEVGTLDQFSNEESSKNLKWWVPTLIVIVLLIGAAVTYFVCVHNSKKEEDGEEYHQPHNGNDLLPIIKKTDSQDA